jgi:hypothetical protein
LKPVGVVMALAAFLVADAVQGRQHVFAEFGRFIEHRLDEIRCGVSKARQIVVAIDVKHVAQQKHYVPNGSLVGRHIVLRASAFDLFGPARAGGRAGRYSVAVLRQRRIAVESEEVIARGG